MFVLMNTPTPRAGLGLLPRRHTSSVMPGAAEGPTEGPGGQPGSVEAATKPARAWGDVTEGRTGVRGLELHPLYPLSLPSAEQCQAPTPIADPWAELLARGRPQSHRC